MFEPIIYRQARSAPSPQKGPKRGEGAHRDRCAVIASQHACKVHPMPKKSPILVVEDDVWARLIAVVLDPATSAERTAAFADFMSPDEPDFHAWCERTRQGAGSLAPSEVRLVSSQAELRANP